MNLTGRPVHMPCGSCGSPLRPCKCEREARGKGKRRYTSLRPSRGFTERTKGATKRYGPIFKAVQREAKAGACWLCEERYDGPGHRVGDCARGVQGGPTAHHVGRNDEDGLIHGGGAAHDLYAGLGGRSTRAHFEAWLKEKGYDLREVGRRISAHVLVNGTTRGWRKP